MRAIRSKDTKPERTVRSQLFAEGYRYRLHAKYLPGTPDIVFPGRKKAILVHGCFWHQHARATCPIRRCPSSNEGYWGLKLERNLARDNTNISALKELGWQTLIVWECDLRQRPESQFAKVRRFLGPSRIDQKRKRTDEGAKDRTR